MRILSISFLPNELFSKGIDLKFLTSDGVRSLNDQPLNFQSAFKIMPALYTQVVMGVVGLNATGKTTILEAIAMILGIVIGDQRLNSDPGIRLFLDKMASAGTTPVKFKVSFLNLGKVYQLESSIACIAGRYAYESETLSGIGLGGFKKGQVPKVVTTRAEQGQGNPYLKDDISIVTTVNACKEKYATNLRLVNANLPLWMGTPPLELVNCFDPGIERITISRNPQSKVTEAQVSFKRKAGGIGQCHLLPLDEILSSGTIKGITLFPMIIAVLVNGGYLIVDELENHLNKKVIEFFIGLFTDCKTNPHGACLVFSTHYAEVLDCITRKDNIYITTRDEANFLSLQRLSDSPRVQRSDLLKSRIFLSNVVAGTAPNKIDLDQAKRRIQDMLEAR